MTTGPDYEIRPYVAADEAPVLALLQRSLGSGPIGERTGELFRWKHQRNPFGPSPAFVADADGAIVGLRTFLRWRWCTAERSYEAVRPVDTATDPDHRGAGIFTRLTLEALDGLRPHTDLVFNTPNDQSRPGYLKMGWTQVGTVAVAIRPVRPLSFARGLRHVGDAPTTDPVACTLPEAGPLLREADPIADLLARSHPPDDRLSTALTPAYLRWRYGDAPGLDYRAAALRHGGRLTGLAIGRPRRRGPLAEFTLSELIVAQGDTATARALLRVVIAAGCDHVATIVGHDRARARAHRRSGFLHVPGQGMILTALPLTEVRPDPRLLASWDFSLGDLELF